MRNINYIYVIFWLAACSQSENKSSEKDLSRSSTQKKVETSIDTTFIHNTFTYKGAVKEVLSWSDHSGEHVVFTAQTKNYHTTDPEYPDSYLQNQEIACYYYTKQDENYVLKWKIYDFSLDCPVDATAHFLKNSLQKTDLDQDGEPEIWTVYRIACKSDVSPSETKIILYEGNKKYKIAGESRVNIGNNEFYGGEIKQINGFENHSAFLGFAKTLWEKFKNESFTE